MPVMKYLEHENNFNVANSKLLNSNGLYIGNRILIYQIMLICESILHLLKNHELSNKINNGKDYWFNKYKQKMFLIMGQIIISI